MPSIPSITHMPSPEELAAIYRAVRQERAKALAIMLHYGVKIILSWASAARDVVTGHRLTSPWLRYPF